MKISHPATRTSILAACAFLVLTMVSGRSAWGFDGMDIVSIRQLAEKGDAEAQSKMGVFYATGVGMKRDKQQALSWYRKSAEQGYPVGQWNLAFMYVRGEGAVAANFPVARELFRQAAEKGFANAQYDLAMMLLNGLGGKLDQSEAKKWFQKAAGQGYREAKEILQELEAEKPLEELTAGTPDPSPE
jgi:uncharacterized protein